MEQSSFCQVKVMCCESPVILIQFTIIVVACPIGTQERNFQGSLFLSALGDAEHMKL